MTTDFVDEPAENEDETSQTDISSFHPKHSNWGFTFKIPL